MIEPFVNAAWRFKKKQTINSSVLQVEKNCIRIFIEILLYRSEDIIMKNIIVELSDKTNFLKRRVLRLNFKALSVKPKEKGAENSGTRDGYIISY